MLALACLLGLGTLVPVRPQDEPTAADELARAEELACRGRIDDARRIYRRLAAELPSTREGILAAERATPSALLGVCPLVENGPGANRIDVVILGDGYTADHQRALAELAEDVPPILERVEPFREYWSYFNFWRGVCVSAEDGIDGFGREHDTLLGGFTRDTDAGHVGVDRRTVLRVLERFPASDGLAFAFVKQGVAGTATNGIAIVGGRGARTTVHEWGHAFAGLGDEYSTHTHDRGAPSARVNLSVSEELEEVPWRHWIEARHPEVGLYEGGSGQVRDVWRPTASGCLMNNAEVFCPVCREALVLRIYSLLDPIESVRPPSPPPGIREPLVLWDRPIEIEVRTLRPATHDLEVSWWIQDAGRFPLTPVSGPGQAPRRRVEEPGDRTTRGPLLELDEGATKKGDVRADGTAVLRLSRQDLEPGSYRITCRVRDPAKPRGERWPWVLADPLDLLASERVWWLEVR